MSNTFEDAVARRWTGIYLRVLAGILVYGASVHIGNMLGLTGRAWSDTPVLWKVMDVVLLVFNVVVAVGLWVKKLWAVVALVIGIIVLQIIPYTVFRAYFVRTPDDPQTLVSLVATQVILLSILGVLILVRK